MFMEIEIKRYMPNNAQNQLLEAERVKEKFVILNQICGINFNSIIKLKLLCFLRGFFIFIAAYVYLRFWCTIFALITYFVL
jgi:hypothetical protein